MRLMKPIIEDRKKEESDECRVGGTDDTETTFDETTEEDSNNNNNNDNDRDNGNMAVAATSAEESWAQFDEYTIVDDEDDEIFEEFTCDEYTFVTFHEDDEENGQREDDVDEKQTKTVRFCATPTVFTVPPRSSYTDKERKRYWQTKEEKERMNRRLTSAVARMLSSSERSEKDRRRRWRGLEQYCCDPTTTTATTTNYKEGNEQENDDDDFFHSDLAKHVSLMVHTIMDEQDRQWLDDVNDEERIAYLSRKVSKVSTSRAKASAENDEEDVIDIYSRGTFFNEMKEILLRCSSGSDHDDGDGDDGTNSSFIIDKVSKKVSKRQKRKEEKGKQQRRRLLRRRSLRRIKSMPPTANY